ncbi:MAG: Clp protease N-terminal domain-containing protein, partial [Janthinobacterium lividum]
MTAVDLRSLLNRLGTTSRTTLEAAAAMTLSHTHYNVEIEHWLIRLAESANSDFVAILGHAGIDPGLLLTQCNQALDRLQTGNGRAPALSPDVVALAREAWLLASVEHGMARVRSGHLLWALLADETLSRRLGEIARTLRAIPIEALRADYAGITAGAKEASETSGGVAPAPGAGEALPQPVAGGGSAALDRFTTDLTAQARAGRIDPILGREGEIRQVIDILTRRRQ